MFFSSVHVRVHSSVGRTYYVHVACRDLEQLQELDLDGNPCASSRGYKHRIVRACPGLLQLDGEDMSQLDRDLSELFFEETEETRHRLHGHRTLGQHLVGGGRPATAPMRTKGAVGKGRKRRSRCGGQPRDGVTKGEESALLGEQISFPRGQPELLAGGARFFSSDRLNDDPYVRRLKLYFLRRLTLQKFSRFLLTQFIRTDGVLHLCATASSTPSVR